MSTPPFNLCEPAQARRLRDRLPIWHQTVPLYHDWPLGHALGGGDLVDLSALPTIDKADLRRDFPRNFLAPTLDLETLVQENLVELEHTSGTAEPRLPLLLARGWWATQECRALRLNPRVAEVLNEIDPARRITLTSPVCNNDICYRGVPSRHDRIVGSSLSLNLTRHPFLWGEIDLDRMVSEALEWNPVFLDTDPVYGALFARHCERQGVRLPSLRFIIGSYEFVSVVHRRVLERAFGVPVFDLFGSTETGHLLMETGPNTMSPSLETAVLEVIDPDTNGVGDLVVTTLSNDYMPLIRYRIGDLVQRTGHAGQAAFIVHGRAKDVFPLPRGERATGWQIDQCFTGIDGVLHYELSATASLLRLRLVPDRMPPTDADLAELVRRLAATLPGYPTSTVEIVDAVLAGPSGKFRLCHPGGP